MPFLYSVNTEYKRLKMAAYPEWVTAHRQKGTEIRHIKGQYYVYEVSSKWNPDKKRAQKITSAYSGEFGPEYSHHQFFGLWRAKIVGIHLWKTQVGSSYYKTYF